MIPLLLGFIVIDRVEYGTWNPAGGWSIALRLVVVTTFAAFFTRPRDRSKSPP